MKDHPEHEYYLCCLRPLNVDTTNLPDNWHLVNTPWIINHRSLWFIFKLPRLIKELELDVFWGPNYIIPYTQNKKTKYIVTVNDLALFRFKGIGLWRTEIQIKLFMRRNIKISKRVIAISKATKNDIIDLFGTDPEKITVTHLGGVTDISDEKVEDNLVRPEFRFGGRFFLYVGTIEPRKNIPTILKAYEIYRKAHDGRGDVARLIVAGGRGWRCESIYEAIEKHPYKMDIIVPGYISDDEKKYLYQRATAFCYPSLYEGFGIPILEAYAYHLPVITAKNSSLTEVGGDAAYYMDTYDADKMAEHMQTIEHLSESDRNDLNRRMDEQLSRFSWKKCANETLEAITKCVQLV